MIALRSGRSDSITEVENLAKCTCGVFVMNGFVTCILEFVL